MRFSISFGTFSLKNVFFNAKNQTAIHICNLRTISIRPIMDNKGQNNIMGLASLLMIGIAVAVLAMIYGLILPILNQSAIGSTPYTLLTYLPTIIIAFVFVGIVMMAMGSIFQKG